MGQERHDDLAEEADGALVEVGHQGGPQFRLDAIIGKHVVQRLQGSNPAAETAFDPSGATRIAILKLHVATRLGNGVYRRFPQMNYSSVSCSLSMKSRGRTPNRSSVPQAEWR